MNPDNYNSDISLHLGETDYSIFASQQKNKQQQQQQQKKIGGLPKHHKKSRIGDLMRRTKYLAAMQQYNESKKNLRFKGSQDFY